jgi:alanine racemase
VELTGIDCLLQFERMAPAVSPLPRVFRPQRAMPSDAVRPTRAEINLGHLRHNLHKVQQAVGAVPVWAVLKADGYGHGAKAVARTLEREGAAGVCVALVEEGIELREAGIKIPILVIGGHYGRAWSDVIAHGLTPMLHEPGQVAALAEEVRYLGVEHVDVHVKVDTGMGRLGVTLPELPLLIGALEKNPQVRLHGLMTHYACADAADSTHLDEQKAAFDEVTAVLARDGFQPPCRHAANSAALFADRKHHLDLVRPGIALFGVAPMPGLSVELLPVMRLRSELVALRELEAGQTVGYGATWSASRKSRIGTIPVGYADGLSRGLSNRGQVLVAGRRVPIVGIVSMDMTMVDVTDIDGVEIGEECVVLGSQKGRFGSDCITAEEIANELHTNPWEVLTSVSRRVPRFYREP